MLDKIPADVLYYLWKTFLGGDLKNFLVIRSLCCATEQALIKPYRKFVMYRLLLFDPRCDSYVSYLRLIHSCDFKTLHIIAKTFKRKRYVAPIVYRTFLALIKSDPTNVFTLDLDENTALCFSATRIRNNGYYYVRCAQWPTLVMVLDWNCGMFATTEIDHMPPLFNELLCNTKKTLLTLARKKKRCNICFKKLYANMITSQKINPGLGIECFKRYKRCLRSPNRAFYKF